MVTVPIAWASHSFEFIVGRGATRKTYMCLGPGSKEPSLSGHPWLWAAPPNQRMDTLAHWVPVVLLLKTDLSAGTADTGSHMLSERRRSYILSL